MTGGGTHPGWGRRLEAAGLAALLLLAVGVRLGGAWLGAHDPHPDRSATRLVAREVAAGKWPPAFHYRQWHLGTLEPLLGGALLRILGDSGYAANLAAVIPGCLALVLVYLLGHMAGGRRAGLAALAYAATGPAFFLVHTSRTYGGYAVMLFLGMLALWLTLLAVRGIRAGRPPSRWVFLLAGLAAGAGWWTSPLVLPFLAAAVVCWVLGLGWCVCNRRVAYLVMGAVAGALPWWIRQRPLHTAFWGTVRSGQAEGWWSRLWDFAAALPPSLGAWPGRGGAVATLVVYGLLFLAAAGLVVRRPDGERPRFGPAMWAAWVLLAGTVALGTLLRLLSIPAARALLASVPAMAVIVGVGTSRLTRRARYGLGWAPLLLLVVPFWLTLPRGLREARAEDRLARRAAMVAARADALGLEAVLVPADIAAGGVFTLASTNGVVFGDAREPGPPAWRVRLEQAGQAAVLDDVARVDAFLAGSGGRVRRASAAGMVLSYAFEPPPAWAELEPAGWTMDAAAGAVTAGALRDADLATGADVPARGCLELVITLDPPRETAGFRLLPADARLLPAAWGLALDDGEGWRPLPGGARPVTPYFWSGPRPYLGGRDYRIEGRWAARTARRLRLRLHGGGAGPVRLAELQLFGPAADAVAAAPDAEAALLGFLQRRGVRRLYADRWLANRAGGLEGTGGGEMPLRYRPGPWTVVVVRRENVRLCRLALERAGLPLEESPVGPWVCLHVPPGAWNEPAPTRELAWTGFALVSAGSLGGERGAD